MYFARPERFELPTLWFEAAPDDLRSTTPEYEKAYFSRHFIDSYR